MFGTAFSIAFSSRHRRGLPIRPSLLLALVDAARFRALSRRSGRAGARASIHWLDDEVRVA
jgi:hypothetical protein